MGLIKNKQHGTAYPLAGRMLIGRAPHCPLRFRDGFISREHAIIEYREGRYLIKELSSTGLLVGNKPLEPGQSTPLRVGDKITIGRGGAAPTLEFVCDGPPTLVAHELNLGTLVAADSDGFLTLSPCATGLPSETVRVGYTSHEGLFLVESSNGQNGQNGQVLDDNLVNAGGTLWMLHLPSDDKQTTNLDVMPVDLTSCTLVVTTDEGADSVRISVRGKECNENERVIVSGSRYATTLLVLAEKKRHDLSEGLPQRHAGWVTNEELRSLLGCRAGQDQNLPYLHPFRLKKLFEAAHVRNLSLLVEREHGSLRLGVDNFEISVR